MSDGVFDRLAPRYDELRSDHERLDALVDVSIEEGLAGATRVLDVGCGTGELVEQLVHRLGVDATGIDRSPAMIEQARARGVEGARFAVSSGERLDFPDGAFDAATMRLVVHLLGDRRPAVFAELARVLAPGGRLLIWTFGAEHLDAFYLSPYLPSLRDVDAARFPEPGVVRAELATAGFARSWSRRVDQHREVDRARAAERLRAGYISTISLLDPDEVEQAARRLDAEAAAGELPLRSVLRWVLVAAER